MARTSLVQASKMYGRYARRINASALRALKPVMERTAHDVITKHFVGPVGLGSKKKPMKSKIVSRTGTLASTVAPLKSKLTPQGILAGVKMSGIQARGLEEGAVIMHPGNVGKLQVFKVGGGRTVFTRKTRPHIIRIRMRAPLRKTMKRWRRRHLEALNEGAVEAARSVGLIAKVS